MVTAELIGSQAPRIRSVPKHRKSRGGEAVEIAASAGLQLDEWQADVLDDALGLRKDGKWAAPEIALNVARQNGKGAIIEARELAGIEWGEQLIIHSAHEFATATEAFLRMENILAGTPEWAARVKSISRSHGHEGFTFKSGQRIKYRTRTGGGGRGFSCDGILVMDEAMILKEAFIGSLKPTQSSQSLHGNPQMLYAGSAVDQQVHEHGSVFARLRARALAGGDPSLAYFEWSGEILGDDGDPLPLDHIDEETLLEHWLDVVTAANPGLGIRISPQWVEDELRSMAIRTFLVERAGIGDYPTPEQGQRGPISVDAWDALKDETSAPDGPVCFAFDVTPERTWGSIVAAGGRADKLGHLELVDRRAGTHWLPTRLIQLHARHTPVAIVCDRLSPAASLIPELTKAGIEVTVTDSREQANACGLLFDAVENGGLRHLGQGELRAAVKGSLGRPLGDAWAWSRKSSAVDISPLVAGTLAFWGWSTVGAAEAFVVAW